MNAFQELAFVQEDLPELEMYQPRYVFCTPTTTYASDTLLGLAWAVLTRDWLWQGPARP